MAIDFLDQDALVALLNDNRRLLTFARDFYKVLAEVSSERTVYPRKKHERRLEAMARLLTGDEVCIAVVFDDPKLLIASNTIDHKEEAYQIEYNFIIQPGSSYRNGFRMQMYYIFRQIGADKKLLREKKGETIHYDYDQTKDALIPRERKFNSTFTFAEHQVFGLPDVNFSGILADIPNATTEFFQSISETLEHRVSWESFIAPNLIGIGAPFPPTRIDPLYRRAEILVEHLGGVAACMMSNKSREAKMRSIVDTVGKHRERVLQSSLSWEVARWLNLNTKMRSYDRGVASKLQEMNEFIEALNNSFLEIKRSYADLLLDGLLEKWSKIVLQKLNVEQITVPSFLRNQTKRFLKRMKECILDLEKLESYIVEIASGDEPQRLAQLLAQQAPFQQKTLIKIIDDCDDRVHAEIRILYHYMREPRSFPDYVAISKLCCAHCGFTMSRLQIDTVSGVHGKAYANWKIPSELVNDNFLQRFLGDNLFLQYQQFSREEKEQALSIIQSIACLSEEQLQQLQINDRKLWNRESEFAYESDEEEGNATLLAEASSRRGMFLAPVTLSGNDDHNSQQDSDTNSKKGDYKK